MMHLWQGDCLELMKNIPDESVDMVLCDPPYGIAYKTGRRTDKAHLFCSEIANDNNLDQLEKALPEFVRVLKNDTACYIFASPKKASTVEEIMYKSGLKIRNRIVWDKGNTTAGDLKHTFGRQYELLFYATKGDPVIHSKRHSDIWAFPRIVGGKQIHQNQKPVALLERAITASSEEAEVVLDPFMGSGSTGVACVNTGRNFIGIELDAGYFEMAKQRIEEAQAQIKMKQG